MATMNYLITTTFIYYGDDPIANIISALVTLSAIIVGIFGLITNILNVAVYSMIGFHDNVSINFFSMSVCDLCFIIIRNFIQIVYVLYPRLVNYIQNNLDKASFYGEMTFDISACVKTFIAVQRGCCVAFPFHVNRIFTNTNTTVVILCIVLLNLVCYVGNEFVTVQSSFQSSITNKSYYNDYMKSWILSRQFQSYFTKTAMVCSCEILVILSLIVIVCGMASTSKWRQSLSVGKFMTQQKPTPKIRISTRSLQQNRSDVTNKSHGKQHELHVTEKQKRIKDKREIRVVKLVTLVSSIHVLCYTPIAIFAFGDQLIVDNYKLSFLTSSRYLYFCLYEFIRFAGPLNAGVNFLVYYTYNRKFKRTLFNICSCLYADDQ